MNNTYAQKSANSVQTKRESAVSISDYSSQGESLQRKAEMVNNAAQRAESPRPNNTGMPDNLKAGIESLSGFSMDDVRVHYNSSKPATVQALAYTQGTDIHVAPGQEKHLPHEAWHVAQQMAGRVSPTTNINGMPVNDNAELEHEADVMGEKAVGQTSSLQLKKTNNENIHSQKKVCQLALGTNLETGKLNVVGERHNESDKRRNVEIDYATWLFGKNHYWLEEQFIFKGAWGDPKDLRVKYCYTVIRDSLKEILGQLYALVFNPGLYDDGKYKLHFDDATYALLVIYSEFENNVVFNPDFDETIKKYCDVFGKTLLEIDEAKNEKKISESDVKKWRNSIIPGCDDLDEKLVVRINDSNSLREDRSLDMHKVAENAQKNGIKGIWKIGNDHIRDIDNFNKKYTIPVSYNLMDRVAFNSLFSPETPQTSTNNP